MQRVDMAVIAIKEDITVSFYVKDWNYDDELENIKIGEETEIGEFSIGCFEIHIENLRGEIETIEKMIEKTKKEIEMLKKSKWNEEEAVLFKEEYLEYLKEEKRKIEEAELVDEIVIEYSKCTLNVKFNGKSVEIDDDYELLFKNVRLKIEKY